MQNRATLTVTTAEAARLLGISRNLAYEAARRGEIPTIRIGRRILVPCCSRATSFRARKMRDVTAPPALHGPLDRLAMRSARLRSSAGPGL
ncbi:MAG: helix-turn-helix domain-containing protein [Vulcanimicrobiaceae bacterium]